MVDVYPIVRYTLCITMILSAHSIPYNEQKQVPEGRVMYSWVDYDEKCVVCLVSEEGERTPAFT